MDRKLVEVGTFVYTNVLIFLYNTISISKRPCDMESKADVYTLKRLAKRPDLSSTSHSAPICFRSLYMNFNWNLIRSDWKLNLAAFMFIVYPRVNEPSFHTMVSEEVVDTCRCISTSQVIYFYKIIYL